jgi:magnesium transporter
MDLTIIGYDPVGAWTQTVKTVDDLSRYQNPSGITWINLNGLSDGHGPGDEINRLAERYRIHPLTVEDIVTEEQRPKVEEFEDYLFITLKAICLDPRGELVFDRVSLVITGTTVISFQNIPGDSFGGIRRRILNNGGRVRRMGADYLAYTLLDSVVDEYFLVLDALGSGIENFEDRAMDDNDTSFIPDLQRVKQNLLRVRRAIWPLRESLSLLLRLDSPRISAELEPFLKDLQENILQAVETVESYRELLAGVMEVNLSAVSNKMNKVMKVLTIISTIFIPLTFIVGVYGMNFANMPELGFPYGYPITWGLMILIALGMILFFKRRNWM